MLAVAVCAVSFNASAWKCSVHNAKGQTWDGTGPTRAVALGNAMEFCSKNSKRAQNCVVNVCNP